MITIVDHDPAWAIAYEATAARVRAALGAIALSIDHVGSTAVPGLPAKPVIDLAIAVPDSAHKKDYVPHLAAAEHRTLRGVDPATNLHVFSTCCSELEQMRIFRNRLRANEADAALYARTKRALASVT